MIPLYQQPTGCWHVMAGARLSPDPAIPSAMPPRRRSLKKLPQIVEQEVTRQASAGRQVRLMFQDEARFGRINDPRRCWAPRGFRPEVGMQIVREYTYAFGAASPHDGTLDTLVLPVVTAEAMSIFLASHLGIPVSTTHTITGAISGVGATQRISSVRWGVAGQIVWAWILTIPASAAIAAMAYLVVHAIGH